jgi:hypothetical protein
MATSKNLTVQSLLLTATRGSTALSCELVRVTALLMEPFKLASYFHSCFERREDPDVDVAE